MKNKKSLSAMQRLWLMSIFQEERWHCNSVNELQVQNRFFAHVAGLKKLQQTQREQVKELITEGWLEIVPETQNNRSVYYRLTEDGRLRLHRIAYPDFKVWWSVPQKVEKMGIQPKLFVQSGEQLSEASVSGEF